MLIKMTLLNINQMRRRKMELQCIVESFINEHSEGSYWDFKQSWHNNNADLLKDIICMANNTTTDMQDGYIIFGVEDNTFKIIDVSDDSNRKNQENVIGFLSAQTWANEEIPNVEVKTIKIDEKEVDVLIIHNSGTTPYYLLKDYAKSNKGKDKTIIHAGVVYSRVGDRNTSSAECATKQATEFLWKKRFGLVGTDDYKVAKRLKNIETWYSTDEYEIFHNSEYGDIVIKRDSNYNLKVDIGEEKPETCIWVMDFPYLFANMNNWNIGAGETGRRLKWDIFLNGRELDISLFGVQGTRQSYYHIEPDVFWDNDLKVSINNITDSIKYYAYIQNSVAFLAFNLFFHKQCYQDRDLSYRKALMAIPVFKSEKERIKFMNYIKTQSDKFQLDVKDQNIDEMFPSYTKDVDTAIVYKLGKTLVQWLEGWRYE
jgi:hypothetical protein